MKEMMEKSNELKIGGQLDFMELKNKQSHKYSISFRFISMMKHQVNETKCGAAHN